jgi:predicted phage baseplate assembly protein
VLVYGQSEELTLGEEPIPDAVQGDRIELDELYSELTSGRWVILSGERTDIDGVSGVTGTELLMISGLEQDFDQDLPGDKTHTTLVLATKTAYAYKRDTNLKIYGNVVKATHGETKNEILGSGDGSQALQSFTLKQPPLTFVAAPNPTGVDSTLQIFVNDVLWHEADTLAGLASTDRKYVTKTDDKDATTVIFGNGRQGARLPTGVQNITSIYRSGIGTPGNVDAEQISMLFTRPLGVKGVINPLRASGGADRENIDQARGNAPLAVMSLDRLVSVQDYADFSRTFAGIGKAASRRLSDGRRELVEITIAGADDAPIDTTFDLFKNLLIALHQFGDPGLPVQVDPRELVVLVLSAKVKLLPDYQWDTVVQTIRAAILDRFGFDKRSLGQSVVLSQLVSLIQSKEGVAYVDVDGFGGIPEKVAKPDGTRALLTFEQMANAVAEITNSVSNAATGIANSVSNKVVTVPPRRVDVNQADFENGAVRPAQLAIFTEAVQDTIVLNQVL